jgi:hypothetical protein
MICADFLAGAALEMGNVEFSTPAGHLTEKTIPLEDAT